MFNPCCCGSPACPCCPGGSPDQWELVTLFSNTSGVPGWSLCSDCSGTFYLDRTAWDLTNTGCLWVSPTFLSVDRQVFSPPFEPREYRWELRMWSVSSCLKQLLLRQMDQPAGSSLGVWESLAPFACNSANVMNGNAGSFATFCNVTPGGAYPILTPVVP